MTSAAVDRNAFELSASVYSVKERRAVGLVTMGYAGSSANEALAQFLEKLRASFPGLDCEGWRWDEAKIDDQQIRKMQDE
jgi:hypothetical protein